MKINAVPVFLLACSLGALAVWNAGRHRSYRQRAMPIVDASGTLVAAMKARSELLKAVTRGRSRPPLTVSLENQSQHYVSFPSVGESGTHVRLALYRFSVHRVSFLSCII